MRKHAESFHTGKGYKLATVVFIPNSSFLKFVVHLSNVIWMKTRPCTPLILYENELLQHCLSYDMRQITIF